MVRQDANPDNCATKRNKSGKRGINRTKIPMSSNRLYVHYEAVLVRRRPVQPSTPHDSLGNSIKPQHGGTDA